MAEDNIAQRIAGGIGREIYTGWTGLDDYTRMVNKLKQGNFLGALKSLGVGSLELGGTVAAILGAPFSGGTSLAARGALAAGTKAPKLIALASKAPRATKALQAAGRGRKAVGTALGAPRRALQATGPAARLSERMMLSRPAVGTGLALYDPAAAAASAARVQRGARNPLRALGVIDPYFDYKQLGTIGTGRITSRLPRSAGAYTRGAVRAAGLTPFPNQSLRSFAVQRSVVPAMFDEILQGPGSDIGSGIVRTGVNQLSEADLAQLMAMAGVAPEPSMPQLAAYLQGLPSGGSL